MAAVEDGASVVAIVRGVEGRWGGENEGVIGRWVVAGTPGGV